jgi:hypothetical protein
MKINMKKYLIILISVVALASCKKFVDVNTNPNTPTVTRPEFVFANALNQTASFIVGGSHSLGSTWSGQMSHSTSFTGGGEEKTYAFTSSTFDFFGTGYDNLNDYQFVINNAAAGGKAHLIGPSKIMQALMFQKLVDLYGNVPYTQALQGTAFVTPAYDNAQTIYESLITKLDEAIQDINDNPWPISEPSDITFASHSGPTGATKWIQFANTVKMRILMRQSFMAGRSAYITTEINKIVAENSGLITYHMLSNPGFTKSPGKLNNFYGTYGYTENDVETGTYRFRKMNAVIINWLKASGDLFRLSRLATPKVGGNPASFGDYLGVPLGPTGNINIYLETLVSSVGSEQVVKGDATRPMILMSAAEAYFLKAEAAQRYGISNWGGGQVSNAQQSYEAGVRWAFRLAAATHTSTATATDAAADAAANAYMANGIANADWSASTDKIKAILVQKWTALVNIDGLEAWSEYRKSNTPTDSGAAPPPSQTSGATVKSTVATLPEPVRLYYPLREENVNGANVQQPNIFTSRIFWDVQ